MSEFPHNSLSCFFHLLWFFNQIFLFQAAHYSWKYNPNLLYAYS